MIKATPAKATGPMNKTEAQALTERIRNAVEDIRKLVAKAHDGKAWKALGYGSWEDYVKSEFGMSRSYAHRLIKQGEVIEAIENAVGDLSPIGNISEGAARELRDDLPAAVEEIKARVEKGEDPAKAAKEIAAAKRAEKDAQREEKKAQQAEFDRQREDARANLPEAVKQQEQAKAEAVAARKAKSSDDSDLIASLEAEIEELREANASLEKELAAVKADNAKWQDMRVQWEMGGFEKVVADLKEVIRSQGSTIERESHEKVANLRSSDMWRKRAEEAGWSNDVVIPIPGRAARG